MSHMIAKLLTSVNQPTSKVIKGIPPKVNDESVKAMARADKEDARAKVKAEDARAKVNVDDDRAGAKAEDMRAKAKADKARRDVLEIKNEIEKITIPSDDDSMLSDALRNATNRFEEAERLYRSGDYSHAAADYRKAENQFNKLLDKCQKGDR